MFCLCTKLLIVKHESCSDGVSLYCRAARGSMWGQISPLSPYVLEEDTRCGQSPGMEQSSTAAQFQPKTLQVRCRARPGSVFCVLCQYELNGLYFKNNVSTLVASISFGCFFFQNDLKDTTEQLRVFLKEPTIASW